MSKVNHDLRSQNGVTIWLPPEPQSPEVTTLKLPDIRTEDTSKMYPWGTRMTTDERAFRYCMTDGAAISHQNRGAGNVNRHMEGNGIGAAVADAYTFNWRIEDTDFKTGSYTGLDLVAYNEVNTYEGGYIWVMNSDVTLWEFHKIVSSLVATGTADTSTDYVTLTLAEPFLTAGAAGAVWCTAYRNIYSDVRMTYPTFPDRNMPVVCVPHVKAAENSYFWGQTWGPMWITAVGEPPGKPSLQSYRRCCWYPGGVIARWIGDVNPATYGYQDAGYVATYTRNTGDMMIMLEMCP